MNRLTVLVEGQTEKEFVKKILAPHLANHGTLAYPIAFGTSAIPTGIPSWGKALRDIRNALRGNEYCTTMVDLYAMPSNWPGKVQSRTMPWNQRGSFIQQELSNEVLQAMGSEFIADKFIPYVQVHEFEAYLFSDPDLLAQKLSQFADDPFVDFRGAVAAVIANTQSPEEINDHYDTCPSRRIENVFSSYRKAIHGWQIVQRIGLESIALKCPNFAQWLHSLETLETPAI